MKDSLLVRNTFWMLLGQGGRVLLQAAYFILLARALGPVGYGAFAGVTALVAVLSPFASLGGGNILIKHVARDRAMFARYWGHALILTAVSGILLLAAVIWSAPLVFPSSIALGLVVCVALADLFFARLIDVSGQAFQAVQRLGRTALIQVLLALGRVLAVGAFLCAARQPTANVWSLFYLTGTGLIALLSVWLVCRELGFPRWTFQRSGRELKEGFYFAISLSAQSVYNDIDKTMLTSYSSLQSAGIYGVAYRAIDVAFTPVRSLLFAAYAKFFQHGASGVAGSLRFAKRLVPPVALYGLLAGAGLFFAAPLVPWVLGADYQETIEALRWLAPLPLLKGMHYFAADALTGADRQGLRSALQVWVAVVNVAVNFWLIPCYGWRGAAWSSLACDSLLMVVLWYTVLRLARPRGAVATPPGSAAP